MAYAILTIVVKYMLWLRQALKASAHALSVPTKGTVTAVDTLTSKLILSHSLRALTIKAIWEARTYTAGTLLGLVAIFVVYYATSPWRKLPPSPRGLPILGNALQIMDKDWLISKDCKERFGEVMYLNAAGQPTILLNSLKANYELLERRAINYSGRPRFIMAQEILGQSLNFSLLHYGDRWRRMRRAAHEALTKRVVQNYHPIQTKEATILASSLLSSSASSNPAKPFHRLAASTILSIVYDHPTIESIDDPTIGKIEDYVLRISHAAMPGNYLVDIFPWMMYIPERFAKWKREGLQQYTRDYAMFKALLDRVQVDFANGGNRPSFCASLLQDSSRHDLDEVELAFAAGVLYAAGAETTATTLSWWALAMMSFPEVQRRAQAELDTVIGRDRVPTFADAPRLPYVSAVIREVLRWRPSLPLGVPHAAIEDDWYEGMFIPKGTVCIANAWHCNHDRAVFGEDADEFRPERHLNEKGELLSGPAETNQAGHVTFGFGRRICVGKELAANSLFIAIACVLWAANLERVRDENGKEVHLDTDTLVDIGLVTRPVPYECVVTPRFPEVLSILVEERERFEN